MERDLYSRAHCQTISLRVPGHSRRAHCPTRRYQENVSRSLLTLRLFLNLKLETLAPNP